MLGSFTGPLVATVTRPVASRSKLELLPAERRVVAFVVNAFLVVAFYDEGVPLPYISLVFLANLVLLLSLVEPGVGCKGGCW